MYHLVESISLRNNTIENLEYHQWRLNRTVLHLAPGLDIESPELQLKAYIEQQDLSGFSEKQHKIRVLYSIDKGTNLQFNEFQCAAYTTKNTQYALLRYSDLIEYSYKWEDRKELAKVVGELPPRHDALIVKNGFFSDAGASNICFYDGEKWFTPGSCLLAGTMRQQLIENNTIIPEDIRPRELKLFKKISLINALNPLQTIEFSPENVL